MSTSLIVLILSAAYAILAKSLSEESLRQLSNIIAGKKAKFTYEEARGWRAHVNSCEKEVVAQRPLQRTLGRRRWLKGCMLLLR